MKKITLLLPIVLLLCCKNNEGYEVETTSVKYGTFYLDVTEEGSIDATSAINITSPTASYRSSQLKINKIIEDGAKVNAGDTVIIFDQSEVLKSMLDREAELEIAEAELERLITSHKSKISELESNLRITEISHQISEINFEQSAYEADITRKEIKLDLERANITLKKAKTEIENQKKIHTEEEQQARLNIKQIKAEVEEARATLDKMFVTTPAPGIAIIKRNWATRNKWQVGDQTWSGNPLIDLPDLSELKVVADINEVDISKIRLGQSVEIKLDAFSDTSFQGTVTKIANLAGYKNWDSKIKVFPIEILIKGTAEILMPGMTVSCKINVDKLEDKTYVPLESLFKSGIEEYVYVKSGTGFKKKVVSTGLSNNDYIVIEEGLKKDEIIALGDPYINDEKNNSEN